MVEPALKDSQSLTALNGLTALQDMQSLTALKAPVAQTNQKLTALKYTQLSLALVHQTTLAFNVNSLTIATLTPARMGGIAYYLVKATGATVKGQQVYIGSNCEHRVGCFRVYARGGTGLPDEDEWQNNSDPYLEVIAYDYLGNSLRKCTNEDSGDESPEWNESLIFSYHAWKKFTVKIWDEDILTDDALSSSQTFYFNSFPIQMTSVRDNAYIG